MKKLLTISILLLNVQLVCAQYLVRGTIYDKATNEVLPYAHIVVANENIASLSNNDGYFEIRTKNKSTQLKISYIGYETKIVDIDNEISEERSIYMAPATYTLSEVVIRPQNYEKLIKDLYNNFEKRQSEKYYADAFYRCNISVDDVSASIMEIFYKACINQSGIGEWNFVQGRSGHSKVMIEEPSIDYLFTMMANPSYFIRNFYVTKFTPGNNRSISYIPPICDAPLKNYVYRKIGERVIDDEVTSVIMFYPATTSGSFRFHGKMEVIESSLQVIYLEATINSPDFFKNHTRGNFQEFYVDSCFYKHVWHYNKSDNVNDWVLERIESSINFQVRSKTDAIYKKMNSENAQMFFYNHRVSDSTGIGNQKVKENDHRLIAESKYDPDFWEKNASKLSEIPFEKNTKQQFVENGFYGDIFAGGIVQEHYPQCSELENELISRLNDNYYKLLRYFVMHYCRNVPEHEVHSLFKTVIRPVYDEFIGKIIAHGIGDSDLAKMNKKIKEMADLYNRLSTPIPTDVVSIWMYMDPSVGDKILTKIRQFEKYKK